MRSFEPIGPMIRLATRVGVGAKLRERKQKVRIRERSEVNDKTTLMGRDI